MRIYNPKAILWGKIKATVKLRGIKKREQGFTLVEVMIALAIIAIMTGIAIPNYFSYMQSYRLRGAASMVRGDLNKAKMLAIKSRRQYQVVFTPNNYSLQELISGVWTTRTVRNLSEFPNVTITAPSVTPIFYPRGTATAGVTIGLQNGRGDTKQVTVDITGRIGFI